MQPSNTPSRNPLRAQWDKVAPKNKQIIVAVLAFAGLVAVVWPMLGDNTKQGPTRKPSDLTHMITSTDPHNLGLNAVNGDVRSLQAQVDALTKGFERITQQNGTNAPEAMQGLREQLNNLKTQVNAQRNGEGAIVSKAVVTAPPIPTQAAATTPLTAPRPLQAPAALAPPSTPALPPMPMEPPQIVITDSDGSGADAPSAAGDKTSKAVEAKTAAAAKADKEPRAYIPSGSMITGVLINGMDAPTGRSASGQPQPVLIRVKREAILPNRFRADVRECFIIAAGYGDLSSERAYLRAESFSCVRKDGKVIDTKLDMYAVGEDGKSGVRGHLVSKQGQAIAKAMVAGFAQSYAQALSPSYGGFGSGIGGGQGGAIGGTGAVEAGAYGGASSALDRVAKFYIDLANQMFPVVEIDAGRAVTLVVLHGAELALAAH